MEPLYFRIAFSSVNINSNQSYFRLWSEIKTQNLILIPIHLTNHWILIVVSRTKKRIDVWDSLAIVNETTIEVKQVQEKFNQYSITFNQEKHQINEGVNCGLFILYYSLYYIISNSPKEDILRSKYSNSSSMFLFRKEIAKKFFPKEWSKHCQQLMENSINSKLGHLEEKIHSFKSSFIPITISNISSSNGSNSSSFLRLLYSCIPCSKNMDFDTQETLYFNAIHEIKKKTQREAFKRDVNSVGENHGIILMDFKSNIKLGSSCEQVSQNYYSNSQRQCFGIWVCTSFGKYFFDLISEDLTKDAMFVVTAFKFVINLQEFQNLNLKKLSIWSDGAKHFRNRFKTTLLSIFLILYYLKICSSSFL